MEAPRWFSDALKTINPHFFVKWNCYSRKWVVLMLKVNGDTEHGTTKYYMFRCGQADGHGLSKVVPSHYVIVEFDCRPCSRVIDNLRDMFRDNDAPDESYQAQQVKEHEEFLYTVRDATRGFSRKSITGGTEAVLR